jgi:hypothetical protein
LIARAAGFEDGGSHGPPYKLLKLDVFLDLVVVKRKTTNIPGVLSANLHDICV